MFFTSAALLALYLTTAVAVYAVLHAANYEISFRTVIWPPLWSELRGSQEKLHVTRAQQAINTRDFKAAILSLQTACELNPRNYSAGLTLAHLVQLTGQSSVADHIYARLMQDVPEQRSATAAQWGRTLLASGNYAQLKPLALAMLTEDSGRREAWLHALLFAARQTGDRTVLPPLLKNELGLPNWCIELISIEQLLLDKQPERALPRLTRINRPAEIALIPLFQVNHLLHLGRAAEAGRLIEAYGSRLPAAEASFLRLRIFRAQQRTMLLEPEYATLLSYPLTSRLATLFCVSLVEQPAPELLARYLDRFLQHGPVLSDETLPIYHATYLASAVGGLTDQAEKLAARIAQFTTTDAKTLRTLGELLKLGAPPAQIARVLPLVPLPIEVIYAIHERIPTSPTAP
jgi:hypothetical protein